MNLPELLAPAGSIDGVRAAVQSGASAVYLGFGTFNARRGAKNFTPEEMARAIAYCRARGVKTNITLNILVSDREREAALRDARFLYEAGADALIVQDVGLARRLRRCAPSLALHASTQMTIATLDGAIFAKELGFSRVVLARETPLQEIRRITRESGIETEIFVHGALCRCYSGQCWLSSVIGRRSGNRGLCAQPCRLPYRYDGVGRDVYPLSLKDLSLAHHIPEICEAGVASLKIEGRMKRPEYTAVVTQVYAALLREQRPPTPEEEDALRRVFSRDGFTDGYFTGEQGDAMFGTKTDLPLQAVQPLYDEAARRFAEGKEAPLVPVRLDLSACAGEPLCLQVSDGQYKVQSSGPLPERAKNRPTTVEQAEQALRKTGGTPFAVEQTCITLEEGLAVPASAFNALRRDALSKLLAQREAPPVREPWQSASGADSQSEASVMADETGILLHFWNALYDGVTVFDTEPVPAADSAEEEGLTKSDVHRWLSETFDIVPERAYVTLAEGAAVPLRRLEALRQETFAKIAAQQRRFQGFTLEARSFEQAEAAVKALPPKMLYLPLALIAEDSLRASRLSGRFPLAAVLPRVFFDRERDAVVKMLGTAWNSGAKAVLAGNLGQIPLLRQHGTFMDIYGDFGLNAFNSDTLAALSEAGICRQTLSFELRMEQIRALRAPLETELILYGRLPLMIFELCAIRRKTGHCTCKEGITCLTDRTGHSFPLLPEYGCRNTLLNSVPLAIPPAEAAGTDFLRLRFTTESPEQCAAIARAFASGTLPELPGGTTRGLYRRGVE